MTTFREIIAAAALYLAANWRKGLAPILTAIGGAAIGFLAGCSVMGSGVGVTI